MPLYLTYHKTGGVLSKFPEVTVVPSHNLALFPECFATPKGERHSTEYILVPATQEHDISFIVGKSMEVHLKPINIC